MLIAAVAVPLAAVILWQHATLSPWAEQPVFAVVYAAMAAVLARLVYQARGGRNRRLVRAAVLATAAFMVLSCTGVATNIKIRRSEDQATAVARLKVQLPPDHRLVSLGHIDALFAYYYADPIEATPWAVTVDSVPDDDHVYFCFDTFTGYRPDLPFEWEEVAALPMDRYKWPPSQREVVVGKRLKTPRQ